jgi:chemotaxis protein MotB
LIGEYGVFRHHEVYASTFDIAHRLDGPFQFPFQRTLIVNQTIKQVSSAVKNGFRDMGTFSRSNIATGDDLPELKNADKALAEPAESAGIDTAELQRKLNKALGKEIERQEITMKITPEGFVISLHELGFFESGQAHLLPGASDTIRRIAEVLTQYGLDMRIEGHSDNVPIHNAVFASNWDLSTARAMTVAMMLLNDAGFDPKRMSIAGYGEYHPAASNETAEGRKTNRRVDIVVVAVDEPRQSH